jgi:hypothetical protein
MSFLNAILETAAFAVSVFEAKKKSPGDCIKFA